MLAYGQFSILKKGQALWLVVHPNFRGGLLRGTSLSSIINEPLVLFLLPLLSREFETPPT